MQHRAILLHISAHMLLSLALPQLPSRFRRSSHDRCANMRLNSAEPINDQALLSSLVGLSDGKLDLAIHGSLC